MTDILSWPRWAKAVDNACGMADAIAAANYLGPGHARDPRVFGAVIYHRAPPCTDTLEVERGGTPLSDKTIVLSRGVGVFLP